MAPVRGPAVPRLRLGTELRQLRDSAGLLIDQVAQHLECSPSKISRLETGKGIPKARDIRDLLDLYRVTDAKTRDRLIRWARDGQQQGWWHDYSDLLDDKIDNLIALEADASVIRAYETTLVHGLLQTEDYARAVLQIAAENLGHSGELQRWLDLRMRRQQILHRTEAPTRLQVILDEPVLLRPVGGPRVLREQLASLLTAAERPNVTIQVLPLSVGMHPAALGNFMVLQFADLTDHDVVCVESAVGTVYLEQTTELTRYRRIFDAISASALDPKPSADFIEQKMKNS